MADKTIFNPEAPLAPSTLPYTDTETDADAIHDNVAAEISAVAEKVAPVAGDLLLIEDSAAANAKKRVQVGNLPGGGGGNAVYIEEGDVARADSSGADLYVDFDNADFDVGVVGNECNVTVNDGGIDHTGIANKGTNTHAQIDTHVGGDGSDHADVASNTAARHTQGTDTTLGTLTADINFATYKAIAMACDNGATLPTSPAPVIGQWFFHTPTGRKTLMQFDGTIWQPISSFGSMTTYVDKTDGTDTQNGGTGVDANAFATVQFAIDQIPPLFSGDVTINSNAETYAEDVVIGGKSPTGDYVIKLVGTLTANDSSLTAEAASVQGTGATQGTVVDTNQINNAVANELVCLDPGGGNEQYRVIDSITGNDTITICGTWSVDPDGETFTTYEWGTEIQSITIKQGQKSIELYDLKFPATSDITEPTFGFNCSVFVEWFGGVTLYRCYFPNAVASLSAWKVVGYYCSLIFYQCSFVHTDNNVAIYGGEMANVTINGTKFDGNGNGVLAIRPSNVSNFRLNRGTVVDNCDYAAGAVYASLNCVINTDSAVADGYNRIRNSVIGIKADFGSMVKKTSTVQYSGNGTNESADAATFAYID